jgi:hypothetical protein
MENILEPFVKAGVLLKVKRIRNGKKVHNSAYYHKVEVKNMKPTTLDKFKELNIDQARYEKSFELESDESHRSDECTCCDSKKSSKSPKKKLEHAFEEAGSSSSSQSTSSPTGVLTHDMQAVSLDKKKEPQHESGKKRKDNNRTPRTSPIKATKRNGSPADKSEESKQQKQDQQAQEASKFADGCLN